VCAGLLVREGVTLFNLAEAPLNLLDDVKLVLDVLKRRVVRETVNDALGGLLGSGGGHGSVG
jgi:hypothetical protein